MKKIVHIGKLDRRITIFKKQTTKTATGESLVEDVVHQECWAKAEDRSSKEEEEGKIYLLSVRDYTIRYNAETAQSGEEMFIRDYDGDFHIAGVQHIGRKSYLKLNSVKRE